MRIIGKLFMMIFVAFMAVVLTGLLIIGPIWLVTWASREILLQDQLISSARPTEARVLSSKVTTRVIRGSKSTTTKYIPTVWYRYSVNGVSFEGRRTTPLDDVANKTDAEAFIQKNPTGSIRQAWYLPDDPSQSFLIRWYSGWPYAYYFGGVAWMSVPVFALSHLLFHSMWMRKRRARRAGLAAPQFGTAAAAPAGVARALSSLLADKVRSRLFQGVILLALTWIGGWQALTRLPAEDHALLWVFLSIFTFAGLLYFWFARRAARIARVMSDPRVFIDPPIPLIGRAFTVRVEQDLRRPVEISEMRIGVICNATTGHGKSANTSKYLDIWHTHASPKPTITSGNSLAQRVAAMGGGGEISLGTLIVTAQFVLPADAPATVPLEDPAHTRFTWAVQVQTLSPACPAYKTELAVVISPTGSS